MALISRRTRRPAGSFGQLDGEAQIVEGLLAAHMLADTKETIKNPNRTGGFYSADNKLSFAIHPTIWSWWGSRKQVDKAAEVLAGKAQN